VTIIEAMTCIWCDPEGSQEKCYRCKTGCRHPKLKNRSWVFQVTPDSGLLPYVVANDVYFQTETACCDRITAFPRSAPNDRSDTSGTYKWRRYGRTYSQGVDRTKICTNASAGTCYRVGPIQVCSLTYQYAKACVLGWRQIAGITTAKLYVSRTQPRYGCEEADGCRYRLALVIDGEIGISWATQITEGSQTTVQSSASFCGESFNCSELAQTLGVWPVGSPPNFNAGTVAVTLHPFRQVFRRVVDHLEFPVVFSAENQASISCGPKCAAEIAGISPSFIDPPAFTCAAPDELPEDSGFDVGEVSLCTEITCEQIATYCGAGTIVQDQTSYRNTLTGSTDSGVVTPGSLPVTQLPLSYTVELN
jgi:hypothetical protein